MNFLTKLFLILRFFFDFFLNSQNKNRPMEVILLEVESSSKFADRSTRNGFSVLKMMMPGSEILTSLKAFE